MSSVWQHLLVWGGEKQARHGLAHRFTSKHEDKSTFQSQKFKKQLLSSPGRSAAPRFLRLCCRGLKCRSENKTVTCSVKGTQERKRWRVKHRFIYKSLTKNHNTARGPQKTQKGPESAGLCGHGRHWKKPKEKRNYFTRKFHKRQGLNNVTTRENGSQLVPL